MPAYDRWRALAQRQAPVIKALTLAKFISPVVEQLFVPRHVVRVDELADDERFAEGSEDLVEAVLQGVAQFAAGEWAQLVRAGAKWTLEGVRMPDGYADAYRGYVEGGWGTTGVPTKWDSHGLPFVIQMAVIETLGATNMSFTLCPTLTTGAIEALLNHGSADQQSIYLRHLATGAWTGTMNLTEPQAGRDVEALRTVRSGETTVAGN